MANRVATIRWAAMIRRTVVVVGLWTSAALGFLATVVAARSFSKPTMGDFVTVVAYTGFFQTLLDISVEEAAIKYGFRYVTQERWGRLRRLLAGTLVFKLAGGLLALLVLVGLAFAHRGSTLEKPLLLGALIPLAQAPEGLAGVALYLRGRYDVRSAFLTVSMGLRLAGVAVGAQFGLTQAVLGMVAAQIVSTAAIFGAGMLAFRRFPSAPPEPLGEDRKDVFRFVLSSSLATGIVSLRTTLTVPLLRGVSTPAQVADYRVAQSPQTGFTMLSAPARMILVTEHTRSWERGARRAVLADVKRYSLLAAGLMAVLVPASIVLMPWIVRLVFTSKFDDAVDAARLVVVAGALQFLVGWSKSLPVAVGRPNLRIWTHGVEALVLLPLTALLGWRWGATGAAGAMVAASAVFVLAWAFLVFRIRNEVLGPPSTGSELPETANLAAP